MTPQEAIQQALERSNAAMATARQTQQNMIAVIRNAVQEAVKQQMAINMPGTRAAMKYVDDIPGKRVPFDMVVSIPVSADDVGPFSQAMYVTPDGYFVATHRFAVFLSAYVFQVTDAETEQVAQFNGRSNGRYRPPHSVCDLMDAMNGWNNPALVADPGDGTWQVESTTNRSPFRTMEFDGTVEVIVRDSDYRRQNNPVPTAVWAPGFNCIQKLSVPDVLRPGTTIDVNLQANHTNNPAAGNIQSVVGTMPYLDGQFDGHEGIGYVAALQSGDDLITRRPDGIFVCGYHGYRILAPASTTA